jgi:hypothetical protein
MQQNDHRAGGLTNDLLDQSERVFRALTEPNQRDLRSLPGGHGPHLVHIDFPRDDLVPEHVNDQRDQRDQRREVFTLVGDRHPWMLACTIGRGPFHSQESKTGAARDERRE